MQITIDHSPKKGQQRRQEPLHRHYIVHLSYIDAQGNDHHELLDMNEFIYTSLKFHEDSEQPTDEAIDDNIQATPLDVRRDALVVKFPKPQLQELCS